MAMPMTTFGVAFLAATSLSASAAAQARDVDPETRIARVLVNLHTRQSAGAAPQERWTLAERMAHYRVPGVSIAVIHDGKIEWARGWGRAAPGEHRAVTSETLFQAASISKALTAFATLRLVDEGVLAVDAPINHYLRSWRLPDGNAGSSADVTIALVLGHMAGLPSFGFPGYAHGDSLPTLAQVLDGRAPANTPPVRIAAAPGATWAYSNGGYLVLQQVLEDVTGAGFAVLMDSLVLGALRMDRSTFSQPLPVELAVGAAVGHDEDGDALPGGWRVHPELAAAGVWTTAPDLARFALAVRAAAVQSPDALLTAETASALTNPRFINFTLGLLVRRNAGHRWFSHNGGNAGYRCLMYGYLTAGEGAVVMTNGDGGMALANEIINSIALVYAWPGFIPETLQ